MKIREEIETWYSEQKQRIQILHEHKVSIKDFILLLQHHHL